jgi:hypothetical protein
MLDPRSREVDLALQNWRQGDGVLGELPFVHRFATDLPITEVAKEAAASGSQVDLIEEMVRGLVVLTQTCDIVRRCADRPFIEVSPLVEVDARVFPEVERARRPQFAFVPGLADLRLVADLDRVMTVEKSVVAKWTRVEGCRTDDASRNFSQALARKRTRLALPDEFTRRASRLLSRLGEKHGKDSLEGRALRALREIRVQAEPDWSAKRVRVVLWFVRNADDHDFEGTNWADLVASWLKLVPSSEQFEIDGEVTTLERLSADDYVHSDRLDFDHLSLAAA